MSNQVYDNDGFYNEEQKNRYLSTLPEDSDISTRRIFLRSKILEDQFETDLFDFNVNQLESLFNYLSPSTLGASRANFYLVQNYIRWAIEQDLRKSNINPLDVLADVEFYKRFVDDSRNRLYTRKEIEKMCEICNNAQDAVAVYLLFEGAMGKSKYDEILNLRKIHIKENNYLELWDESNSRIIQVSDACMRTIRQALNETTYLKKNGYVSENLRPGAEARLVDNDYVLKNVETRNKSDGKADPALISRRVAAVKSYNSDWVKVLTPYTIRKSGMLYMAAQLYYERGVLDKNEYGEISEQFGITKIMNNGFETYNYHRLREDFLNVEHIRQHYPDKDSL